MYITIMQFPPIKEGEEDEFRRWFKWSGDLFKDQEGLVSRRLLKPVDGGTYVAIVEVKDRKTFEDMHQSPAQARVHDRLVSMLEGKPTRLSYEPVAGDGVK